MKSIVSFLGGIIFTLLVLVGVGYFAVKAGIVLANADSKPAALENWVANTALDATLERDTKGLKNPDSVERRESDHRACTYTPKIARYAMAHRMPSLRTLLKASISRHRNLPRMESKMIPRPRPFGRGSMESRIGNVGAFFPFLTSGGRSTHPKSG